MTRKKRAHYSKETKQKARTRARVCRKVTGCSSVYAHKKGLCRQVLLEELETTTLFLLVGEDRKRGKVKKLIEATLNGVEHLHNQSPRNKYINVIDANSGEKYRISYHQSIRRLTPEGYEKLKKKQEMKENEVKLKKNEAQSIKGKIRMSQARRDEKGRFIEGKYRVEINHKTIQPK